MGIFISAYISDSVKQSEWLPVYEKSLMMAKKLRLFDFGYRDIHGKTGTRYTVIYSVTEAASDAFIL